MLMKSAGATECRLRRMSGPNREEYNNNRPALIVVYKSLLSIKFMDLADASCRGVDGWPSTRLNRYATSTILV